MKLAFKFGAKHTVALAVLMGVGCGVAAAQDPIVVGTAAAIAIQAIKPKKQDLRPKFEGTVMNSNSVLITVRSKTNELAVQTFTLSPDASVKMQKVIDKGGYQYGDKVTVYYDPTTHQALRIKGKASKPI
ncbi:MAG: hypothetical protein JSS69_00565 [Acidobacteria bacterium]|nr:hypothetical protein [Acidobacteriota bacterium]MBS1864385.1 hypothetical protein [Acidobacteriota bacterium]